MTRLVALKPQAGRAAARDSARPRRRSADAQRLVRAQGCLPGQLAGNALGSAFEFRSAADMARSPPPGAGPG
ncbi:hypothetical protein [Paracoccus spongiarum]|uniref:Uncharacterized protein n=1 Tax=Paracoccus spongiarum TaxID=3064387 RepID=A0ABT9J7Y4_9RHOB|nr:hypothetical protein [Paracoccus sp. 2205BS29-5]MDP5305922.1 hypothetical protein [Paracoccus sp. 2205BS29-5]